MLSSFRAFILELLDEASKIHRHLLQRIVRSPVQDDRGQSGLVLGVGLLVLELHVLQLLDHSLVVGLGLFERLTPDLFVLGRERLVQEEVISLENPGETQNGEDEKRDTQNFISTHEILQH